MAVTTSLLLVVADKGQEVLGGLSLLPQVEKRFSFDVSVPAGWQVTSVTAADGRAAAVRALRHGRRVPSPPLLQRERGPATPPDASASPCPPASPSARSSR